MKYFQSTPKIAVTDKYGNSVVYRNIMARSSIKPALLTNPLVFYEYDVQEGDTPEIVAHKYYGDMNRYWIVMFSNQIMDPQWDWPLDYRNLVDYIESKYDNPSDTHFFEKTITITNLRENSTTTNNYAISEEEYNSIEPETKTFTLSSGTVVYELSKSVLTHYEYEVRQNDAKRTIKLLNKSYATQLENEFQKLMSS
jgi:hypothetical protein